MPFTAAAAAPPPLPPPPSASPPYCACSVCASGSVSSACGVRAVLKYRRWLRDVGVVVPDPRPSLPPPSLPPGRGDGEPKCGRRVGEVTRGAPRGVPAPGVAEPGVAGGRGGRPGLPSVGDAGAGCCCCCCCCCCEGAAAAAASAAGSGAGGGDAGLEPAPAAAAAPGSSPADRLCVDERNRPLSSPSTLPVRLGWPLSVRRRVQAAYAAAPSTAAVAPAASSSAGAAAAAPPPRPLDRGMTSRRSPEASRAQQPAGAPPLLASLARRCGVDRRSAWMAGVVGGGDGRAFRARRLSFDARRRARFVQRRVSWRPLGARIGALALCCGA
jgi:hypothetical protein